MEATKLTNQKVSVPGGYARIKVIKRSITILRTDALGGGKVGMMRYNGQDWLVYQDRYTKTGRYDWCCLWPSKLKGVKHGYQGS